MQSHTYNQPEPGYNQPAQGYHQPVQGYNPPPQKKTNGLAIASLIVAFIVAPVGAILGHVSLGQIKKNNEGGRGLALAGIIIGWAFTAIGLITSIFMIMGAMAAINAANEYAETQSSYSAEPAYTEDPYETEAAAEPSETTDPAQAGGAAGFTYTQEFCAAFYEAATGKGVEMGDDGKISEEGKKAWERLISFESPNRGAYQKMYDALANNKYDSELTSTYTSAVRQDAEGCVAAGYRKS